MGEILVGVDGSEGARTALRWASNVAASMGASLRVVWAWQYPPTAVVAMRQAALLGPDEMNRQVEERLAGFVTETLGDTGLRVRLEAGRGPAVAALLHATLDGATMLVVGSRGLEGFRELLLGSVSRQLCEHAPCPVTVVRGGPVSRLRSIVVGTDGSPGAERALRFAGALATSVGANLVVANAVGDARAVDGPGIGPFVDLQARRDWIEEWCEPLRDDHVPYDVAVTAGDARTALLEIAADRAADLLVVGSRGRGPVTKLLLGSVASSLVHHGELPVTVVRHAG